MDDFRAIYLKAISEARAEMLSIAEECDPDALERWISRKRPISIEDGWNMVGCTDDQIEEIREAWNGHIPESIDAFYGIMGTSWGFLQLSSSFSYPTVLEAANFFEDWVEEVAYLHGDRFKIERPEGVTHIGNSNGYLFEFFQENTPDPMIMAVGESSKPQWKIYSRERFSQSILRSIKDCEASMRRLVKFS